MLDVAVSYNRFKFLGNEFLTWLWFLTENDTDQIVDADNQKIFLGIGNKIVLENQLSEESRETISIKGDDADLKEGIIALKKGAVVTELHLILKENENEWKFTIKGESFHFGGLKPPETGKIENKDDIDGAVLEKYYLYEKCINVIDAMFKKFIILRISSEWDQKVVSQIKEWIRSIN